MKRTILVSAALILMTLYVAVPQVYAQPIEVNFDPGDYSGSYGILGVGSFTGPAVVSLSPGSYVGFVGHSVYSLPSGRYYYESRFTFSVDEAGVVTVDDPVVGTGGVGSLTFNNIQVSFDPESYSGAYGVTGVFSVIGGSTQVLVPGLGYVGFVGHSVYSLPSGRYYYESRFTFSVDEAGVVTVDDPVVGTGGVGSLTFNNICVVIHVGGFAGNYGTLGVFSAGGDSIQVLVPGVGYVGYIGSVGVSNRFTYIVLPTEVVPSSIDLLFDGEVFTFIFSISTCVVQATIDIDPDTLNLKSRGKWITAYMELPEGYDVSDIDVSTVELDTGMDRVPAELQPIEIRDYDEDGIADLMVKFDRAKVAALLSPGEKVELTVTGELTDGTKFEGSDTIRVIDNSYKGS